MLYFDLSMIKLYGLHKSSLAGSLSYLNILQMHVMRQKRGKTIWKEYSENSEKKECSTSTTPRKLKNYTKLEQSCNGMNCDGLVPRSVRKGMEIWLCLPVPPTGGGATGEVCPSPPLPGASEGAPTTGPCEGPPKQEYLLSMDCIVHHSVFDIPI